MTNQACEGLHKSSVQKSEYDMYGMLAHFDVIYMTIV
jgi:hypothetical protein